MQENFTKLPQLPSGENCTEIHIAVLFVTLKTGITVTLNITQTHIKRLSTDQHNCWINHSSLTS